MNILIVNVLNKKIKILPKLMKIIDIDKVNNN